MLRDAGYRTGAFVSAFPVTDRFGLAQGFETFDADFLREPLERIVGSDGTVNTGRNQRHAGETTDRALAWLSEQAGPFFLWVHYFDPHDPQVMPPKPYFAQYEEQWRALPNHQELLRAVYDVETSFMDEQLGRIVDALEARGELEHTVVVVVADHGEGLGDHDWWTHGILYQEQIRVPLLLVAPSLPAGRRVDPVVRTIDIVPTVAELVGLDAPRGVRWGGRSLVPLVRDPGRDPGWIAHADSLSTLTYRITPQSQDRKRDLLFAVIQEPWKYIHHLRRPEESELYHLGEDPGELHNRYASDPNRARRMLEILRRFDFMPSERTSEEKMSPEDLERLRALGYVH